MNKYFVTLFLSISSISLFGSGTNASANANAGVSAMDIDADQSSSAAADEKRASAQTYSAASASAAAWTQIERRQARMKNSLAHQAGQSSNTGLSKFQIRANYLLGHNAAQPVAAQAASAHQYRDIDLFKILEQFDGYQSEHQCRGCHEKYSSARHGINILIFPTLFQDEQRKVVTEFKEALDNGADPNQVRRTSGAQKLAGIPILAAAAFRGIVPIVKMLLAHPNIQIDLPDPTGKTALFEALYNVDPSVENGEEGHIACLLISKNANVEARDHRKRTVFERLMNRMRHMWGQDDQDSWQHPNMVNKSLELLINLGAPITPNMVHDALYWGIMQFNFGCELPTKWPTLELLASYGFLYHAQPSEFDGPIDQFFTTIGQAYNGEIPGSKMDDSDDYVDVCDPNTKSRLRQQALDAVAKGHKLYAARLQTQNEALAPLQKAHPQEEAPAAKEKRNPRYTKFAQLMNMMSPSTGLILPVQLVMGPWIRNQFVVHNINMPLGVSQIIADYHAQDLIHPTQPHNEMDGSSVPVKDGMDIDQGEGAAAAPASASANADAANGK